MGQDVSNEQVDPSVPARTLRDRTLPSVAKYIASHPSAKIVVLTGAGISTSAGIPDFRSPDTGLYSNLARLDLPYPEAVFDISFFRQNPKPFYLLAQELYPGKYHPTVAHAFIKLLERKGLLHMLFTQNIDCLERRAGVPGERIVEAHGSFATQRCIDCKTEYPDDKMQAAVQKGEVPHCEVPACGGLVKPDIVFFGEALPDRFHDNRDVPAEADLLIIMGTSLTVHPFAGLPEYASQGTPRLLLNMEQVGSLGSRPDDVLLLGDCDTGVRKLADELGWRDELEELFRTVNPDAIKIEKGDENKAFRTRHEQLEDEVAKLTEEVDHALKISNGHKEWLEKHLDHKVSSGPPKPTGEALSKEEVDTVGEEMAQDAGISKELIQQKESEASASHDAENRHQYNQRQNVLDNSHLNKETTEVEDTPAQQWADETNGYVANPERSERSSGGPQGTGPNAKSRDEYEVVGETPPTSFEATHLKPLAEGKTIEKSEVLESIEVPKGTALEDPHAEVGSSKKDSHI
jgi:NAD-dependent histone deacetylase SIR2